MNICIYKLNVFENYTQTKKNIMIIIELLKTELRMNQRVHRQKNKSHYINENSTNILNYAWHRHTKIINIFLFLFLILFTFKTVANRTLKLLHSTYMYNGNRNRKRKSGNAYTQYFACYIYNLCVGCSVCLCVCVC